MAVDSARSTVPDWVGGIVLIGAVFGSWTITAVSAAAPHPWLPLKVAVVISALLQVCLLALVAPFGNYERSRSLWIFWPFLGVAYAANMAWHCGVGLARISGRIRVEHPDQRIVTRTGRLRS